MVQRAFRGALVVLRHPQILTTLAVSFRLYLKAEQTIEKDAWIDKKQNAYSNEIEYHSEII
jgi:hypothetical protein